MTPEQKKTSNFKRVVFFVRGMTCSSCASRIEKTISGLPGVMQARVNFGSEQMFVDVDPNKIFLVEILQSIKKIGFEVLISHKTFPIKGLTCASCVSRVENKLDGLYGVLGAQVNLATNRVSIDYISSVSEVCELQNALRGIGYTLFLGDQSNDQAIAPSKLA